MYEKEQNSGHMTRDIIIKYFIEIKPKRNKIVLYLDSLYVFNILAEVPVRKWSVTWIMILSYRVLLALCNLHIIHIYFCFVYMEKLK